MHRRFDLGKDTGNAWKTRNVCPERIPYLQYLNSTGATNLGWNVTNTYAAMPRGEFRGNKVHSSRAGFWFDGDGGAPLGIAAVPTFPIVDSQVGVQRCGKLGESGA